MTVASEQQPQQLSIEQAIDKWLTIEHMYELGVISIGKSISFESQFLWRYDITSEIRNILIPFMNRYDDYRFNKIKNDDPSDYDRPPFRVGSVFN